MPVVSPVCTGSSKLTRTCDCAARFIYLVAFDGAQQSDQACTVGEIAVVQEQSRSDLVRINV
jgi:hypothetical protein